MNDKQPSSVAVTERYVDPLGNKIRESFEHYLLDRVNLPDAESNENSPGYKIRVEFQQMADENQKKTTVLIDFQDVIAFSEMLATAIMKHFYRVQPHLQVSVFAVLKTLFPTKFENINLLSVNDNGSKTFREFWVSFYNLGSQRKIRELRTKEIGSLVSMTGTVTRTSEVRPELIFGVFRCLECGALTDPVVQQFKYTEPNRCANHACLNKTKWQLDLDRSRFVDWQRVRVQENAQEIPSGSMPRCVDVIMRNDCVELAKAGDRCLFTGSLIVVPDVAKMFGRGVQSVTAMSDDGPSNGGADASKKNANAGPVEGVTGLKVLGVRDLNYKLCFLCSSVEQAQSSSSNQYKRITAVNDEAKRFENAAISIDTSDQEEREFLASCSAEQIEKIRQMQHDDKLFEKLVASFAPNIYGHDDVKKGILLMLAGGVHKETEHENINLRGDINVCVVGDPSTAKSQFLKYVSALLPRAVYTSGKASSAAGLTASVVKDSDRGEFTIEAGALMLADNGVCCIDEFDKMDQMDQVAIHEAMEQQTISIAKAGIRATLNARASILAAANPIGGRYNPRKTLRANLGISPAIMSRFDLFFVVRDECDDERDSSIARHIVRVHQGKAIEVTKPTYSPEDLRLYLSFCKTIKPELTEDAKKMLVLAYRRLRQNDKIGTNSYRITVRQLESLIRLSEAIARLHYEDRIEPYHVREAVKLLRISITKIDKDDIELDIDGEDGYSYDYKDEGAIKRKRTENQANSTANILSELRKKQERLQIALQKAKTQEKELETEIVECKKELEDLKDQLATVMDSDDQDADLELKVRIEQVESTIGDKEMLLETIQRTSSQFEDQIKVTALEQQEQAEEISLEPPAKKQKTNKRKVKMNHEEYMEIASLIIEFIRDQNMREDEDGSSKCTREYIRNWYVVTYLPHLSAKEARKKAKILDKVISKMVLQDAMLLEIEDGNSTVLIVNSSLASEDL